MATLAKLIEEGTLTKVDVALDGNAQPWRELYAYSPSGRDNRFIPWLRDELPGLQSSAVGSPDTPEEQLYALLELYVIGEPLTVNEMYKPLHPHSYGIWELRTIDVRVFGWFYERDRFIAVFADTAERIHQYKLHAGYRDQVIRLRNALDLDEPKFATGINEHDIVSICPKSP